MKEQLPALRRTLKVAVLLGAEPYQAFHVADIAFQLSGRAGIDVEFVATLAQSLDVVATLARSERERSIPRRLLGTPLPLRILQKLTIFGSMKSRVMRSRRNVELLSGYDAIVTPADHALVLRSYLQPLPLMIYVNHGIGGRAASYSNKYLSFDFVVVASKKDETRLLGDRLIRPGKYVVAYPKLGARQRTGDKRARLFANDRPLVLFNSHSKRSLRSWERFARPLIDHVARTGEFNLIIAPHVKLFGRKPYFAWRRWERLAVTDRVIVDLGSQRSLNMTYTTAADIYVGDVSSQVAEFLTSPKPCVFLNAHGIRWRNHKDFANWDLGDVVETPAEAVEAIRAARSRHHTYEALQRERIETWMDVRSEPAARAAEAIERFVVESAQLEEGTVPCKVMFLVSDLGTGGTGRATMLTASGLAKLGVETLLVVMRRGGVLEHQLDQRVKFFALERGSARGPGMLFAVRELARIIRAERPTRLVSAGNHMHVLASLAHRLAGVPGCQLVLKMTNPMERPGKPIANFVRRVFYAWAYRCAARILVIAQPTLQELSAVFPDVAGKLVVVDNPYVTDAMLDVGEARGGFQQGRLLAIGRLVPQKNFHLLLTALSLIVDLAWDLDVLGDGPMLSELEQTAQNLGIGDRVNFRGYVPDPLSYLGSAHALVLSSDWEGQGAVLLEALACGCPVIATRSTDAVSSVLNEGRYGRLVPPRDAQALARAISAELGERSKLPHQTRDWVRRYRIDAGVESHLDAIGCAKRVKGLGIHSDA